MIMMKLASITEGRLIFAPEIYRSSNIRFSNFFSLRSVPFWKVMGPFGDVIFACEMDGGPLPRNHGYLCRVSLLGHAGRRQCKWVHKMVLSDKESNKC